MNGMKPRRHAAQILTIAIFLSASLIISCSREGEQREAAQQQQNQQDAVLKQGLQAYRQRDYERALALLKPLAESGQSEAQRHLGVMYRHGLGVDRDDGEAMKWYQAAAEQGHVRAQNNLGIMYLFGLGTAPDSKKAEQWLLAAAKQNDAKAQENLGILYTKQNQYNDAVHYLTLAAGQNQVRAQLNLGLLLLAGNGIDKDESGAMKWISKAAEGGSAAAAQALAKVYRDGLYGFSVDEAQAEFWAARAVGR